MRQRKVLRARVRRLCPVGDIGEIVMNCDQLVVHWLHMVAAIRFFAEAFVFEGMGVSGIVVLPTRVELVELMGCVWRWTKEGLEKDF